MKQYGEMNVNKYQEMKDSRIAKGLLVLRREGLTIFLYRFIRYLERCSYRAATPLVVSFAPSGNFLYQGKKLRYFHHKKNLTWTNERKVEIPIAISYIKEYLKSNSKPILEIGAVLPHYYPAAKHDVVDKFEKKNGIINEDVITFKPTVKYDLIISISTLEHVGFDDDIKDPNGILKALANLKSNCLSKKGKMIITIPIGYNKYVDQHLAEKKLGFDEEYYLRRSGFNKWKQSNREECLNIRYGFLRANAIAVGVINS